MWYEILPTFGIILATLAIPAAGNYWVNRLVLGNPAKRELTSDEDVYHYVRDWRISGNPYKQVGLENIPDE